MDCTDMVIGMVRESNFRIYDAYTRDRSTPQRDEWYEGQENLKGAIGMEINGWTHLKWRKPLTGELTYREWRFYPLFLIQIG